MQSRTLAILRWTMALIALSFSGHALADKASMKADLIAARERVVAIVSGQGDAAKLKPELSEISARIDKEAGSVPGFQPAWEKFKANRDGRIIPAFDGSQPDGKDAAKALAMGEQKQLYEQMMGLLSP